MKALQELISRCNKSDKASMLDEAIEYLKSLQIQVQDESSLIWISSSGEKSLKLGLISRIIPGQRTAVFQRYLRPDKDYLSFSLIYNNGKRSLDLICKDKVEAELWIAGLKVLISSKQGGRSKIDGWSEGGLYIDVQKLKQLVESQDRERAREAEMKIMQEQLAFLTKVWKDNFSPPSN